MQLSAQNIIEVPGPGANEVDLLVRNPYADTITLVEPRSFLPVECEEHRSGIAEQAQLDPGPTGYHKRAVGQGMGAYGSDHDYVKRGLYDRPACREGIGCRSCRSADYKAVRLVVRHLLVVNICLQVDDPGERALVDDNIVQDLVMAYLLSFAMKGCLEADPGLDGIFSLQDPFERPEKLPQSKFGEEPEGSEVDPE